MNSKETILKWEEEEDGERREDKKRVDSRKSS